MTTDCPDCGKTLHDLFNIEGRCYKCHSAHERKPLQEEIERLRAQVKELESRNAAERFWIVLKDTDRRLHRHTSKESAEREAKRLAIRHSANSFFALEVISGFLRPLESTNSLNIQDPLLF